MDSHSEAARNGRYYTMPAEGAYHSHTLMALPSIASAANQDDLRELQKEVVAIANSIAKFEPVHLYVRQELFDHAQTLVASNVLVKTATVDQLWLRDSAPIYAYDQHGIRTAINFNFNYWGQKLDHTGDENFAAQVAAQENEPSFKSWLTTEGGAIEHDGEGTFLGTESSLVNENRNPGKSRSDIEKELRSTLGVSDFIWVPGVRGYDITDYHIDILARFVRPGVVVISEPAANAPDFAVKAYEEAAAIISNSKDSKGRTIQIIRSKEPELSLLGPPDKDNEVVASYVNYHLVNGAIFLPKYGQEGPDSDAFELFQTLFPSRKVVQLLINMLPRTGGGIHCATQQVIPKVRQ